MSGKPEDGVTADRFHGPGGWLRRTNVQCLVVIAMIALADWLFYRRTVGWTLGFFLLVLTAVLCWRNHLPRRFFAWVFPIGLIGLVGSLVYQPGPLALCMSVLFVGALAVVPRVGWTSSVRAWCMRAWHVVADICFRQAFLDRRITKRWMRRHARRRGVMTWVSRWIVPGAICLVFVGLLKLANPIIGEWVDQVTTSLGNWVISVRDLFAPSRIAFWFFVGMTVWVLLRTRAGRRIPESIVVAEPMTSPRFNRMINTGFVVRCLVLFNALFAVETVLDGWYLFGGAALPKSMTYAQYAHRGAYPLLAAALLAGTFVLVTFRRGGPADRSRWARLLVYLWVSQNIFLMGSAMWRLRMYVDVYSLSRWRVAAGIWMVLIAVGFALVLWRIVRGRSNAWLLRANVLVAAMVVYGCCFVNFDSLIAWYNVTHCHEVGGDGVPIDLGYLQSLGPDALPAVVWLARHKPETDKNDEAASRAVALSKQLQGEFLDWRGWTWRRHAMAADLLPLDQKITAAAKRARSLSLSSRGDLSSDAMTHFESRSGRINDR